jgi:hypothetical protein
MSNISPIFTALFICLAASVPTQALTVKVERIDTGTSYTAIKDTESIKYVERCTREKFALYEWKTWEGYYSARAYIMPLAIITVRRESDEMFGGDLTPFIKKAQSEAGKIGANIFCYVRIKNNKQLIEPDLVIFRAYKQLFQAGNASWEAFFKDLMEQGFLLTLEDIQKGEKTKETLEKHKPVKKKSAPNP